MTLNNKALCSIIREARIAEGITQKEMADLLSRDVSGYSKLENGHVTITAEDLFKIAQYLKIPPETFSSDNENNP